MYEIDARLAAAINGLAGHALIDTLMIWISALGVPFLVLAVAAQWWWRGDRTHRRHVLVATGFSFLLGLFFNQMILLLIQRPRPYESGLTYLLIERSADYSFPSDHATASFAIAAAFLLHGMRRTGFCFLVAAVVLSFTRVYIGTHYPSDILGGMLTAVLAAVLVRAIYREGTQLDRFVTGIL